MNTKAIINRINNDKSLLKQIKSNEYYSVERFIEDAKQYLKAIEQNRMICNIGSVSKSGMSRTMKFVSCEKSSNQKNYFYHRNYFAFLTALGYKVNNDGYFRVNGCGMDMVFYTNYSIVRYLGKYGFLTPEQVSKLEQQTPTCI